MIWACPSVVMAILAFRQGVLLLNATLTVEAGLAGSHQNKVGRSSLMPSLKPLIIIPTRRFLYYGAAMQNIKVDLLIHQNTWC